MASKTPAELTPEETALAAEVSAAHAAKAAEQAEADAQAAEEAEAARLANPDELVFTHRTSRGTLCACDFGASESTGGAGTGGHADGLHPEMQEDGTVGARQAARATAEQEIADLRARATAMEEDLAESEPDAPAAESDSAI